MNGLAGGLTSNLIGYAMDGQTTLNILNTADFGFGNTGLLELTISKENGVSSRIGMGGTNVSFSNISSAVSGAAAWNKNSQINKYTSSSFEGNKDLANALRMQYGFGDKTQLANLNDILNGTVKLELGGTDGKAQTVSDGTNKTIYMNVTEGMDWKEMGLVLGHEAYRDGIVGTEEAQRIETRSAVNGHTEMALKMLGDSLYTKDMLSLMDSNKQLNMEMILRSYGKDKLDRYSDMNYDSSSDYWKMLDDGTLIYDGKKNLYDENDDLIYETSAGGLESSLIEILYGKNATETQINDVRDLLESSLKHYVKDGNADDRDNWYWNMDSNKDKKVIDGQTLVEKYGGTMASQVFAYHYDSTVDSYLAYYLDKDIGDVQGKYVPHNIQLEDRLTSLSLAKLNFYNSMGSLFESNDTDISGVYGDYIRDNDGNLLMNYKLKDGSVVNYTDFYQNYDNLHYGIDLIRNSGSNNLLLGISGKVETNGNDSSEGWTVRTEYGYKFEQQFISTGIYGEYGHLKNQSTLIQGKYYNANTVVGLFGNTGNKTTGAHLHYSIYTKKGIAYSDTTMRMVLGKNYQNGSIYNKSWRTVYNPTNFYNAYK